MLVVVTSEPAAVDLPHASAPHFECLEKLAGRTKGAVASTHTAQAART
jgi:hypothetical protein